MTASVDELDDVLAIYAWRSNAHLIADVARLGYLDGRVLDPTYGHGVFWRIWRPDDLVASDVHPEKSPIGRPIDFTLLPWETRSFDVVVFDPPYKLNGTPSDNDERYGVQVPERWQDRMTLCLDGIDECARVADHHLLVKCKDQVVSGKKRWQTRVFADRAESHGFGLVDRFDIIAYRKQPDDRRQVHARTNASTLLVFRRGWDHQR